MGDDGSTGDDVVESAVHSDAFEALGHPAGRGADVGLTLGCAKALGDSGT
jgi:hypothetical protein